MKRSLWLVSSVLVALILSLSSLVACAGSPSPTPAPPTKPTEAPKPAAATPSATVAPAKPTAAPAAEPVKAPAKVYRIGVSEIVSHPAIDESFEGFLEGMKKSGLVEGKDFTYDMNNAQGDMATNQSIAQKLVSSKPDLIVSISTPSSQAVVKLTKDIPVVFVPVTDPKAAGLVTNYDKPDGNVTGVSDMQPEDKQLDFIFEVVPTVKRIGMMYKAGETNSVVQVEFARTYLKGKAELVEATASNTNEVQAAAQSLVGRVDAIFVPTDSTVIAALQSVVKVAESNKIPVFVADITSVKLGAVASLSASYKDMGVKAGEMAAKILRGEAKPGDLPVVFMKDVRIVLNKGAAQKMGVTFPESVLKKASQILD